MPKRKAVIIKTEREKQHWLLITLLFGLGAFIVSLTALQTLLEFVPRSESLLVVLPMTLVILLTSLLILIRLEFRNRLWRLTETTLERGSPVNLRIPLDTIQSIRIGLPGKLPYLLRAFKKVRISSWRNMMLRRRHTYVLTLDDGRMFTLELSRIPNGREVMRALRQKCYDKLDHVSPPKYTEEEASILRWGRVNKFHRTPKVRYRPQETVQTS